jgi:drug/metabolite transporter (DMT)-like permease
MRPLRAGLRALPPVVQAALLMIVGAACVAVQNGLIREVSTDIHTFEVVFFRNLFGLAAMLPLLSGVGLGMFRARSPGRLMLMSIWHVVGMICYFLAIAYLPLAEVTALAFSKPLFATIGAALVLHEIVRARRWSAVALGFIGVLIVLQPGAQAISPMPRSCC